MCVVPLHFLKIMSIALTGNRRQSKPRTRYWSNKIIPTPTAVKPGDSPGGDVVTISHSIKDGVLLRVCDICEKVDS